MENSKDQLKGNEDKVEVQEVAESNSNLDDLLDDALEDFNKPIHKKVNEEKINADEVPSDSTNAWTDEFIKQATQNFESTMKCVLEQQKVTNKVEGEETNENSENAQLDYGEISAEFAKFAETAAKAATEATSDQDFTQCLAQTMQQMTKNKEEAQAIPSTEDMEKMFEQFGLGQNDGEMGGLFPLMQTMLENILSKDVLYHPIKEIVTKYPDWLADNRSKLSEAEFDRYSKQFSIMKRVTEKFESEKDTDSEEAKAQNFEAVLKLMQTVQEYGHPPPDLVGDQGSPLINFDEAGNPQMPDLSSILGSAGFPSFGGLSEGESATGPPGGMPGNEQCSIM